MSLVETLQQAPSTETDRTAEDFRPIFQHLDAISKSFRSEVDPVSKAPWFSEGLDILSTVDRVGVTVLPFVGGDSALLTSTFNTLVIGDVTANILSLGVLVHRLFRRKVLGGVAEAKVMVQDTFRYLQRRLERLHYRMGDVDAAVLPLKELVDGGEPEVVRAAFRLFEENVRLCRLDIGECLEKLDELRPKIDKCVKKLCRYLKVSSAMGGILGAAGLGAIAVPVIGWPVVGGCLGAAGGLVAFAADCAMIKSYFVEHRAKCDSIYPDLQRMLKRLRANVDALKEVGVDHDVLWELKH